VNRRDFLRLSAAAGTAVALGNACSGGSGSEDGSDASKSSRSAAPKRHRSVLEGSAADSGIDTVVVAMMENRSFDSYFGWLARDEAYLEHGRSRYGRTFSVDGESFQQFPGPDGALVDTYRRVVTPDVDPWRACGHPDPGHSWTDGRAERDGGFLAAASGNDDFALSYFEAEDLPFYDLLTRRFTVCDRWHASLLGPTYPNRLYLLSAQSGGHTENVLPIAEGGYQWESILDRLAAANVPVVDYYTDLPPSLLFGERMLPMTRKMDAYFEDAAAGKLPAVTFVSPSFIGDERSDDHPHGDPRAAQRFVRDAFAAFSRSPHWERGLFVLVYDEWGGFFDHVPPPHLPDDRASSDDALDFSQAGFRVPAVLCSPRALPGALDHTLYDHTSVLRFLEWRFLGAPAQGAGADGDTWYLTARDRNANNLGRVLVSDAHDPDLGFDLDVALAAPSGPCAPEAVPAAFEETRDPTAFELAFESGYLEMVGLRA
jgi:phospholipase C